MTNRSTAATVCPHGCARCRAIEAGMGGRGFTVRQFIDVFGLVERPPKDRPVFGGDTLEAKLAYEVAQVARDDAQARWFEVRARADEEKPRLSRLDDRAHVQRLMVIDSAEKAAFEEWNAAKQQVVVTGRLFKSLEGRDRSAHRAMRSAEERDAARKARDARRSSSKSLRKVLIGGLFK